MSRAKLAGLTLLQADVLKRSVVLSRTASSQATNRVLYVSDIATVATSAHYDCVRRLMGMGLLSRAPDGFRGGFQVASAGFEKCKLLEELAAIPSHTLLGKACNRERLAHFARVLA